VRTSNPTSVFLLHYAFLRFSVQRTTSQLSVFISFFYTPVYCTFSLNIIFVSMTHNQFSPQFFASEHGTAYRYISARDLGSHGGSYEHCCLLGCDTKLHAVDPRRQHFSCTCSPTLSRVFQTFATQECYILSQPRIFPPIFFTFMMCFLSVTNVLALLHLYDLFFFNHVQIRLSPSLP
jgi:hypothetical protein